MDLREGTKTVYLAVGNETQTRDKLVNIDLLSDSEVWIVYSNKITPECERYIRGLADNYSFVTLDCVMKSKKNKISNRLLQRILEFHECDPNLQIVLLSKTYRNGEILTLANKGMLSFCDSIIVSTQEQLSDQLEGECKEWEVGGKMQILIDYENVGTAGLKGAEYLCKEDAVTLFYSASSSNIERQYIDAMEKQSGRFDVVKLRAVGKNGLDFYIAVKVGQIAETDPNSKVLIITKDSGYQAIIDYCQGYTALKNRVVIKADIESGIVAIDGGTARRQAIIKRRERLSIESEYSAYKERNKLERDIIEACRGTKYEEDVFKILEVIGSTETPRERYLSSLHLFGRNDGAKVYRIIKQAV